ncbi:PepSY domain-containing protein [Roseivivax sediminis]|uniref:Peptidase propeptide and YPEB domain-containing protein n=1 Tax=Roseivivax sediminis TaxID=936889 RepID=A0A1I2D836_9RHOB|nr:PepSY domain-containing protein [Roseivivax sediminis]SFE76696.1 hypothetical protein SAMN04515678_1162 [Roseivivax sediminis]
MPRFAAFALCLTALAPPAAAQGTDVGRVLQVLAEMGCEVSPADIEKAGSGYALHDVLCPDGRYEIVLDGDFRVTSRTPK